MTRNQFNLIQFNQLYSNTVNGSQQAGFQTCRVTILQVIKYWNQWWTNNNLAQAFTILSIPTKEFGFQNRDKVCLHKW